jgi:uncharacterized DUF497 family protein
MERQRGKKGLAQTTREGPGFDEIRMYTRGMEFEWDEEKRLSNIEKHGFDFRDVEILFDGRPTYTQESPRGGEDRYLTTADFVGRLMTVVWTARGNKIRIISVRRARDAEERNYRQLHN